MQQSSSWLGHVCTSSTFCTNSWCCFLPTSSQGAHCSYYWLVCAVEAVKRINRSWKSSKKELPICGMVSDKLTTCHGKFFFDERSCSWCWNWKFSGISVSSFEMVFFLELFQHFGYLWPRQHPLLQSNGVLCEPNSTTQTFRTLVFMWLTLFLTETLSIFISNSHLLISF